mmetsp:Transcript_7340/g.9923  ORF Transcript_7340/g.9923 Transcript_7340/m.9923 type:complete len:107 (-) Transcript_7340:141-461(-)
MQATAAIMYEDVHDLGLSLLEFVFSALALSGPSERTSTASLERIFEGLFYLDMDEAREYFASEDEWELVLEFLDRNSMAGWDLLNCMLTRNAHVDSLLRHRFFEEF